MVHLPNVPCLLAGRTSARKAAKRVSDPCRTEASDFREVGIVRDHQGPEA